MASLTTYLENKLLDHVLRNTAYTPPTTVYMALYTAVPTDAGGGTEVSGNGYARKVVPFAAASGGSIASSAAVSFTANGGDFGSVIAVGIFDALTGGNLLTWKQLSSAEIVNNGDTLTFPVGDIIQTLD